MVVMNAKQQKITSLWRKPGRWQDLEDCEDLEDEIKELEKKLKETQNELFQVQRNSCKRKVSLNKTQPQNQFSRPTHIIRSHNAVHLEYNLELMALMTGMEVKSYSQDHCVIIYNMQHHAPHSTLHGVRINTQSGENTVANYSMPLGFNFQGVVEKFDSIMTPDCLVSIRNALDTYYDRLQQFEKLKSLVSIDGQLFKVMDTTHVEVSFKVQLVDDEVYDVVLTLDYRVYDKRPKLFYIKGADLDRPALDVLTEQCGVFKKKPLDQAFAECFMENGGPYNIVRLSTPIDVISRRRRKQRKRGRPQPPFNSKNDDTFHPEDCSDYSEEEDERGLRETYGRR